MLEWDDLRFFLALAQAGSVRAASAKINVSHSTVARRVEQLEKQLGVALFSRTPDGYRITPAGSGILAAASRMDDEVHAIERQLLGQDTKVEGCLNVTLPDVTAIHLYMDDFADFSRLYPDISLDLHTSYDVFDLARGEADVALRMIRPGASPPEHLLGRKLAPIYSSCYANIDYLRTLDLAAAPHAARWLGWTDDPPNPRWVSESQFPEAPVWNRFNSALTQAEACKQGMGLAILACFIGDNLPMLTRVPPGKRVHTRDIWLLSHPDLRDTARVRVFREFIAERTLAKIELLSGNP